MVLAAWRNTIRQNHNDWCRLSAIHPEFAKRVRIRELYLSNQSENQTRTPIDRRCSILKPGRHIGGSLQANLTASYGLEYRDPTADVRVLEYMYSIPDKIFIDPDSLQDRWIIREAMKGKLPEVIRLNCKFGVQAADLVTRLRGSAEEVEATLRELATGPAVTFVDIPFMYRVWHQILTEDTMETYSKSISILTRGIMAGLFVNQSYE